MKLLRISAAIETMALMVNLVGFWEVLKEIFRLQVDWRIGIAAIALSAFLFVVSVALERLARQ